MRKFIRNIISYLFSREMISYALFGVLTVAVNYGVFWLILQRTGGGKALWANTVAFVVSTLFAFFTNKLFVFQSRGISLRESLRELIMFFSARVASFAVEELGLWACTGLLHVERYSLWGLGGIMVAKIILSVIVIAMNFVFSKFIIFR